MIVWKKEFDAHITVHPVTTSSFLPIIFSPPGAPVSIHIALYLPTSGKENEFIEQICLLRLTVEELLDKYPNCLIFLRGDSNVNSNNKSRFKMFSDLLSHFSLVTIPLYHKTYHHFLGGGLFDSEIDIIAVPKSLPLSEKVTDILCSKEHTEVDSHHDVIVSCLAIPTVDIEDDTSKLLTAPRVLNLRKRIIWSEDAITKYQAILSSLLPKLRNDWYASSPSSFSVLLKATNEVLDYVATETNKSVLLNAPPKLKRMAVPPDIRKAHIELKKAHNIFKLASVGDKSRTSTALTKAKQSYRLAVRRQNHSDNLKRDSLLFTIYTTDSSTLLKKIRFSKRSA